jgi:hypothetical protein
LDEPATKAYPILEDSLRRYSEQRRKRFKSRKSDIAWRLLRFQQVRDIVYNVHLYT